MKKLLILLVASLFTFSSFAMNNKARNADEKAIVLYIVYYHCADGVSHSFLINDLSGAQAVANHLCGY